MVIAPVIFCTVVTGIAGMESMKAVGRTGAVALLYFEIVSTIALIIGLIIVNVVQPGAGMNVDPATLDALVSMSPQRIVYVSCNPSSMLRDLKFLAARGFATAEIQPVDMFPHTPHVECVAKIVKAN